ncbi:hypothetical protein PTSG_12908 [Salpingoeca rosetta]|uniref:USP domain-containing protein n=1 Tax=Salpingoeca rosetta (strain ATCC 50818 / BSB-021) TaxID=946362 RepID=F2UNR1_SALR5|nr:uncharacterized protein PTSG_12908 [Salpingoeca rosetta]EGD79266.1 hypothetical protein PTSG_12908 [Salpingoeca rosetta]|eukprot:XP_004989037.1 hypothetical protein PTSG_12908 [Salpingoeca rosetta]
MTCCAYKFIHDFLLALLGDLHEQLRQPFAESPTVIDLSTAADESARDEALEQFISRGTSTITDLFQGQLRSVLKCSVCHYESSKYETFRCLSLPVPQAGSHALLHCFDLFSRPENLTGDMRWKCPQCKTHRDAEKCTGIWRLPRYLIVHLMRFTFDKAGMHKTKTMGFGDCGRRPGEQRQYRLCAVANHYGSTANGHYTAIANHKGR